MDLVMSHETEFISTVMCALTCIVGCGWTLLVDHTQACCHGYKHTACNRTRLRLLRARFMFFLFVFSRSYCCYRVWSAIGRIRSSVCLSLCNAVHCGSQGRCRPKSCTSVFLAGKFLFVRSDTFTIGPRMYRVAAKRIGKKRVAENASRSTSRTLLLMLEWNVCVRSWRIPLRTSCS